MKRSCWLYVKFWIWYCIKSKSRKWTDEELETFVIILVDDENAFAQSLERLALKKESNNDMFEKKKLCDSFTGIFHEFYSKNQGQLFYITVNLMSTFIFEHIIASIIGSLWKFWLTFGANQKQPPEEFLEISQNLQENKIPVNFAKFLRTRFCRTPLDGCF